MRSIRLVFLFLLITFSLSFPASAENDRDVLASVRSFVQGFYDWYVPKTSSKHSIPAWSFALEQKNRFFDAKLATALNEDLAAQAKAEGEIVGLDFDPFLGGQDPWKRYVVGSANLSDGSYRVELHGVADGKALEKPSVIAELTLAEGHWRFANFYYADGKDLLTILSVLREGRESSVQKDK